MTSTGGAKVDYQDFDNDTAEFVAKLKRVLADINIRVAAVENIKGMVDEFERRYGTVALERIDAAIAPVLASMLAGLEETRAGLAELDEEYRANGEDRVASIIDPLIAEAVEKLALVTAKTEELDQFLTLKQSISEKGLANGYAGLDAGGKVPASQLPASLFGALTYQGTWNASSNSPAIPAASGANKGWYFKVATAGSTTVSGGNDWKVGDWIVSNGASWDKIDNTDQVTAVVGLVGSISAAALYAALGVIPNGNLPGRLKEANSVGNIDANTLVSSGWYFCGPTAVGNPWPGSYFHLWVSGLDGGGRCLQKAAKYNGKERAERQSVVNGAFLDWDYTRADQTYLDGRYELKGASKPPANKIIMRESGDYEPSEGVAFIIVKLVGAGGGGGATAGAVGQLGYCGIGGGTSIKTIMGGDLNPTETVSIGAGGAGGTGAGKGGNGGTTSFGLHFSATGGSGGAGSTSGATGDAGVGVGGDINLSGNYATETNFESGGGNWSAIAGLSSLGGGAGARAKSSSNAVGTDAAANSGAGGGGARSGGAARNGGAGGSGLCEIEEYF